MKFCTQVFLCVQQFKNSRFAFFMFSSLAFFDKYKEFLLGFEPTTRVLALKTETQRVLKRIVEEKTSQLEPDWEKRRRDKKQKIFLHSMKFFFSQSL